jgi:hypothetical protein
LEIKDNEQMKDKFYEEYAIQNDLGEMMDIHMQTIKTIEQIIQQISKLHNITNNEDTKNKISNEIKQFKKILREIT